MALRNQPYLPLYVQDFMTDEKLAECSASATGVYIRLMCLMHKSECYGKIILKQKDKVCDDVCDSKNDSTIKNFALKISKHLPYNLQEIEKSISELVEENVVQIDGDVLYQKRMVRDSELSEKRSLSGKRGNNKRWNNDNSDDVCDSKTNRKNNKKGIAKTVANSEYESEYENDIEIKEKKEKGVIGEKEKKDEVIYEVIDEFSFENVWSMYGKKGNKKNSKLKWEKLPQKTKQLAITHIPRYTESTPDMQYRKNFETYINQEAWNDEIIFRNNGNRITENTGTMGFGNTGNGQNTFRTDADRRKHEREVLKQISTAVLQQHEAPKV